MPRSFTSIPGQKDAGAPRSGQARATGSRSHLVVIRPGTVLPSPPHRGMWHTDSMDDPLCFTSVEGWPQDHEFAALIDGALQGNNFLLAAQLEEDRAYCGRMRSRLEAEEVLDSQPG